MKRISNADLQQHFLAWQCRIRQASARDYGGQPTPGMRPRVLTHSGLELMPAMTVLLVPLAPQESTAFLKFQVQCTNEAQRAYDAGIRYLAASHYQQPELFSDEMTAVFGPHSPIARSILDARNCILDFEQYGQRYTMFCKVRCIDDQEASREASLWHNRVFNSDVPEDSTVLAFLPDWKNAHADPMPFRSGG